jgi:SAM-dependent methyltransferase
VKPPAWDDAFLDGLREEADPPADAAVAAYFADLEGGDAGVLFRRMVDGRIMGGDEAADAHVAAFLNAPLDVPGWADPSRVRAGQRLFARWGPHVFTALYGASLPSAYACWRGVEVLALTARLETDARRRLNETAQFHLDVMASGGLLPGSRGVSNIRHVRLMHSAVRWLITHDRRARWDYTTGLPLNQEDILETLLTFSEVVFEVFDKTGVAYTADEADTYLHTWSLIGHFLGVRPDLLPLTSGDAAALMAAVRRRQYGASDAGRDLTAALLAQATRLAPPGLRGLPATTVRYFVGDATAALLQVPPADWTRCLFGPLAAATRAISAEELHHRVLRRFSEWAGFRLLALAVRAERSGGRAPFAIPTELADGWGVDVKGGRKATSRLPGRKAGRRGRGAEAAGGGADGNGTARE